MKTLKAGVPYLIYRADYLAYKYGVDEDGIKTEPFISHLLETEIPKDRVITFAAISEEGNGEWTPGTDENPWYISPQAVQCEYIKPGTRVMAWNYNKESAIVGVYEYAECDEDLPHIVMDGEGTAWKMRYAVPIPEPIPGPITVTVTRGGVEIAPCELTPEEWTQLWQDSMEADNG
jgi:hypothetical protein